MTDPQGNAPDQQVDAPSLSVQQYIEQVPLLLDGRGRARHSLRRFVVYLATFADPDGSNIFPSVDRVAKYMHCSRRTVFRLYREAEQAKQIVREGHTRGGMIKCRLNLELPCAEGWLPYDVREEHRREMGRARLQRWREKRAEGDTNPVTDGTGGDTHSVSSASGNAVCVTQPSISDHHEDHHQTPTAVAAATRVEGIIDAELVDDDGLPDMDGPPLLTVEPPAAGELVLKSSVPAIADLSAQWLLPEPEETGKRKRKAPVDSMRFAAEDWQLPREQHTPSEWTKTLVGYYVDAARACRFEPSGRQIGQVGKEVKGLIAAGNNPVHILSAVRKAAEKRGAWVVRAMADVQPGNWSAGNRGRQIVTSQGVQQLPQGIGAAEARHLSIMSYVES